MPVLEQPFRVVPHQLFLGDHLTADGAIGFKARKDFPDLWFRRLTNESSCIVVCLVHSDLAGYFFESTEDVKLKLLKVERTFVHVLIGGQRDLNRPRNVTVDLINLLQLFEYLQLDVKFRRASHRVGMRLLRFTLRIELLHLDRECIVLNLSCADQLETQLDFDIAAFFVLL